MSLRARVGCWVYGHRLPQVTEFEALAAVANQDSAPLNCERCGRVIAQVRRLADGRACIVSEAHIVNWEEP